MPQSVQEILTNPNFHGLPLEERRKVLLAINPDFGSLSRTEQDKVIQQKAPPVARHPALQFAMDLPSGVLKGARSTAEHVGSLVGLGPEQFTLPQSPGEKLGFGLEQMGEFFLPGGLIGKGAKALAKAPKLAQIAGRAGMEAASAGVVRGAQTADPGEAATAAGVSGGVALTVPALGRALQEILGITTGAGGESLKTMARSTGKAREAAVRQMRAPDELKIVGDFREALQTVRDLRGTSYRNALSALPQNPLPSFMDPVRSKMMNQLNAFGIKVTGEGLDWSRARIPKDKAVDDIFQDVMSWGSTTDDLTPLGLDTLKRRISNYYSEASDARAFIKSMEDTVSQGLNRSVPRYEKMTRDYAVASKFIRDIEQGLSMGHKASEGAAVTRLTTLLKQNNEYRKILAETLDQYTDKELKAQVAGYPLSKPSPRGLASPLTGLGILASISTGMLTPRVAVALAVTSPRLVGELVHAMSLMSPALPKLAPGVATQAPSLAGVTADIQQYAGR